MNSASRPTRQIGPARTGALLVVLAGAVLSGCSGSSDDTRGGASPGSAPVSAGSTSSTGATAATATATPGDPAATASSTPGGSASVSPATGTSLMSASVTLSLPAGWIPNGKDRLQPSGYDPSGTTGGDVIIDDQPRAGDETVEQGARLALRYDRQDQLKPVRQPNITVDGVEGYVITGSSYANPIYYEFGTVANDHNIVVSIAFATKIPAAQAQATIDSILASVTLA